MPLPTNYGFLATLMQELGTQKAAAVKAADQPLSEAGGFMGATTHPSKNVPDNTQTAVEGSRSSENERDDKDTREQPSVDTVAEATSGEGSGKQDEVQLNIGTVQSATGEDSSVEDAYKGDKDDPGTTAKMDTNIGDKYGEYRAMPSTKLAAAVIAKSNDLLASLATPKAAGGRGQVGGPGNPGVPGNAVAPVPEKLAAAAASGYALAQSLGAPADKQAQARDMISATVSEASHTADLVANHLYERQARLTKAAAGPGGEDEGESHKDKGGGSSGGGDISPMGGGPPPGGGGPPPMGGGPPPPGGGGGGGPLGGMGAPPPGAPPGLGADPSGGLPPGAGGPPPPGGDPAMGGDPSGGPGGGGDPNDPQALVELAAALMDMGIDPQALAQAAAQGGAPGGPKLASHVAVQIKKAADDVIALKRSGKFAFAPARTDKQARMRQEFRDYVAEVFGTR